MNMLEIERPICPTHWTGHWVRYRLREAFEIEARLPGERHGRGNGSAWLLAVQHEFSDMVHWQDARQRVWEQWARAKGAHPWEVSRAEEALDWLPLLRHHDAERRCLTAWAVLMARRRSVRAFLGARKWSRTTFLRRVTAGSERIALELEIRGVQIR